MKNSIWKIESVKLKKQQKAKIRKGRIFRKPISKKQDFYVKLSASRGFQEISLDESCDQRYLREKKSSWNTLVIAIVLIIKDHEGVKNEVKNLYLSKWLKLALN